MFRFRRPRNKEEDVEFRRSNSLQLSRRDFSDNGDLSITFIDDTDIQIIISSDIISSPSHDQTLVEPTLDAASLHNEIIWNGKRKTVEEGKSSLKRDLIEYARRDKWHPAQFIFDRYPDMVRVPLTVKGKTALHVAVRENSSAFALDLVKLMTPKDLELQDADGSTALCMAATAGNGNILQIMIKKNENSAMISRHDGMLPVHLAALAGHHNIVQYLTTKYFERMALKDIERLFLMTISSSMYDVATKLFKKYPPDLAMARDDQELTALHMLARKHSEKVYMQEDKNKEGSTGRSHGLQLLKRLWSQVSQLEYHKFLALISKPYIVLFDAVKSGNVEAVKWILYMNRELLTIKDSNGRNLLHYAVLYRQRSIFDFILKMKKVDLLIRAEDKDRNNVLHLAMYQPIDASPSLILNYKREIMWLKEVEKRVPHELKKMKNSNNQKPEDIFLDKYEEILREVKGSDKIIAQAGMVVATLTATVAFAAALTVPGDKNSAGFIVFILSNAVALFSSSASIVSFMSTFGKFTVEQFIILLHPCVIIGRWLLFISITAMIMAFGAASFLIFDNGSKWVAYAVASLGILPIMFMVLVLKILPFHGLFDYFFRSRYYY